jgi:hypothetical protein
MTHVEFPYGKEKLSYAPDFIFYRIGSWKKKALTQ